MPYIERQIECVTCRGKGQYHAIGTFNKDDKRPIDCLNCKGRGFLTHQVFVNPIKETDVASSKSVKKKIASQKEPSEEA